MSRQGGLGRGLAALIPPAPPNGGPDPQVRSREVSEAGGGAGRRGDGDAPGFSLAGGETTSPVTLAHVAPEVIAANPRQPREVFDEEELEGLASSLSDMGMLQPLVVRPLGNDRFELVAGERRLRAARLAGLDSVPVVIRHTDDADLLKEALVENIHRVQLNPLEEAAAYQQLLEEFEVTQEE